MMSMQSTPTSNGDMKMDDGWMSPRNDNVVVIETLVKQMDRMQLEQTRWLQQKEAETLELKERVAKEFQKKQQELEALQLKVKQQEERIKSLVKRLHHQPPRNKCAACCQAEILNKSKSNHKTCRAKDQQDKEEDKEDEDQGEEPVDELRRLGSTLKGVGGVVAVQQLQVEQAMEKQLKQKKEREENMQLKFLAESLSIAVNTMGREPSQNVEKQVKLVHASIENQSNPKHPPQANTKQLTDGMTSAASHMGDKDVTKGMMDKDGTAQNGTNVAQDVAPRKHHVMVSANDGDGDTTGMISIDKEESSTDEVTEKTEKASNKKKKKKKKKKRNKKKKQDTSSSSGLDQVTPVITNIKSPAVSRGPTAALASSVQDVPESAPLRRTRTPMPNAATPGVETTTGNLLPVLDEKEEDENSLMDQNPSVSQETGVENHATQHHGQEKKRAVRMIQPSNHDDLLPNGHSLVRFKEPSSSLTSVMDDKPLSNTERLFIQSDARSVTSVTVASSTYHEERRHLVNATVLDPHGEYGRYTGTSLASTGMPHGLGKMIYDRDGRTYEGDWRHGMWHGFGKATFGNGDSYEGEYKFDQRHGGGLYKWKDGRTYNGEFAFDKRHGKGKYAWPDGSAYTGDFVHGQREGEGEYRFSDGGSYTGTWLDGFYEGYGECHWADGRCYKGAWKAGAAHGKGVEAYADGTIRHDGMWEKDEPILQS